ncbi:hypothetical protein PHMEG_00023559 [Phytophthora megakarya]|uniref:Peptidase A2 domain-containing protein n=1 Tax=Phytophthora megakarya TaxID=4795 RepID=A0A225VGJ7_9STRA|nr:hypothetical protein PHMEG_00023559 [Phytophthora megakarya]
MADQRGRTAVDLESNDLPSRLPLKEDVPGIDWERLRWFADQIVLELNLRRDYWERVLFAKCRPHLADLMLPDEYSQDSSSPETQTQSAQEVRVFRLFVSAVGEFRSSCDDDISHYVNVISTSESIPGFDPLRSRVKAGADRSSEEDWFDPAENAFKSLPVVRDDRRVVCSVGHFEACSSGYIDCLPVRMLADTGATLSLVDSAVLERLGRTLVSLQPYEGRVSSSSGHTLLVKGWTHLPIRLGALELSLEVLVVDQLHIDAILGVDALCAFGAVFDVANRSMVLQRSGETIG